MQSFPYTEGNIPTQPLSQPSTESGASDNEEPIMSDLDDHRSECNVTLPPANQLQIRMREARVVRYIRLS